MMDVDPPPDRHAGRDRRVSRAGGVGGSSSLADTLVPDRPPSLFAGSPLLLMGRYRGRPHGPVEVRGQDPGRHGLARGGRSQRPRQSGDRRGLGARAGAPARGPLRRRARRSLGPRANHHRDLAAVRRLVPVHGLCGRRPRGGRQRGGRGAPITQPVEMPAGWGEDTASLLDPMCYRDARIRFPWRCTSR